MSFVAGSPVHWMVILTCAIAIAVACALGRRWRRATPNRERRWRLTLAWFIIVSQISTLVWWMLPERHGLAVSLPLHICDIAVVIAVFALVSSRRWPRSLVYYWGAGLSVWAFIIPVLRHGPATVEFWVFWLPHLQVVGTAAYVVTVLDYRPTLRDLWFAAAALAVYAAIVIPLNGWLGTDYGYMGPGDSGSSMLGDWPWRAVALYGLEVFAFFHVWAPWPVARYFKRHTSLRSRGGHEEG